MIHSVELYHTILYQDIDNILENSIKPKVSEISNTIICGASYYFYPDEPSLNEDFERLTTYLKQLKLRN